MRTRITSHTDELLQESGTFHDSLRRWLASCRSHWPTRRMNKCLFFAITQATSAWIRVAEQCRFLGIPYENIPANERRPQLTVAAR